MTEASVRLNQYFQRIGYRGQARPDLQTLQALFAAHVAAIPFENINVQLQWPLSREPDRIFDKLVDQKRGGWCYEQNGLLGWALAEIGFAVMPFAGGVMRVASGDFALGNHLGLIVQLEEPWLVDAGFGGSLASPIALREETHDQSPYSLNLKRLDDGYWRFAENSGDAPFSFDFLAERADEALLDSKMRWLQSAEQSPFVQNLVVQQRKGDSHVSLRGRVLTKLQNGTRERQLIESPEHLLACLRDNFGLDVPEVAGCWDAICDRHEALFGDQTIS